MLLLWACGCCYLLTGTSGAAADGLLIRAVSKHQVSGVLCHAVLLQ